MKIVCLISALVFAAGPYAKTGPQTAASHTLAVPHIEDGRGLDAHNVLAEPVTFRGRRAVRIADAAPADAGDDTTSLAVVKGSSLENGTIEVSLTGDTLPTAFATARGFVGIAFRVSDNASSYECFYLRPKNGRAEDQLQRNHTTQYISVPGYQWYKLRQETPGKYESYVDLVPGEWTRVKIRFSGKEAQLYVNGAEQPALVVHDLKQPVKAGAVALWVGSGTVAHFADLSIRP